MILVAYDIANDKLRTKFANYLSKHGYRLQYSIFQIKNSQRILSLVSSEIKNRFEKEFSKHSTFKSNFVQSLLNSIKYDF